jgi:hypothetical protein
MSAMASPAAAPSEAHVGPSLDTLRDPSEAPPASRISISARHVAPSFETDASTKTWLGSPKGLRPRRRTTSACTCPASGHETAAFDRIHERWTAASEGAGSAWTIAAVERSASAIRLRSTVRR